MGVERGDAVFFASGTPKGLMRAVDGLRNLLARALDLLEANAYRFCWVTDFPFYELDPETNQIAFSHNPFSMPQGGLEALNTRDPLTLKAFQYDIVCNGVELSSGAIRNHRPDIMLRAFEIAGYKPEEVEARFGGMLNAFRYGAPPHGGLAPGVDRIVMLLAEGTQYQGSDRLSDDPECGRSPDGGAGAGHRAPAPRAPYPRRGAQEMTA